MNTRVNQQTAETVVRESLGLSAEDLGMNPAPDGFDQDDGAGDDLGDTGSGDDGLGSDDLGDSGVSQDQGNGRQSASDDGLGDLTQPQAAPQRQSQPDRIPAQAEIRTDGKGNLVDRKTGQIVAKAGAEARMYQKMHKAVQQSQVVQAQNQDLTQRLNKAIELGTQMFNRLKEHQERQGEYAPERYGLQAHEAVEALNFAKMAKSDPVSAIKAILTRASAGGIDLSSIGLQGGNFDPKSLLDLVRGEISQQMNPLKERSQRETAQEQARREAEETAAQYRNELNNFLTANPQAREFLPVFQKIYEQPAFQNMSLGEVWARVQLNLIRQNGNQRPANQQRRGNNPRIPNGRNRPPQGSNGKSNLAPVDMSYEDIVRDVIRGSST
jgi:hypothetical protein